MLSFFRRRQQQQQQRIQNQQPQQTQNQSRKDDISHLIGKPRAEAVQSLRGKTVQYIALKNGEPAPAAPDASYIVCYDSVTDIVTSAA